MARDQEHRCGIALVTLMRHLDGELTGARAGLVARHLAACRECRDRLDALARLRRRLRAQQPSCDRDTVVRLCAFAALLTRTTR